MYSPDLFKNKHVLVTGGRSGIGYEIARSFLKLGASVTIISRNKNLLKKSEGELSLFGKCDSFSCNIKKTEEIDALCEYLKTTHKTVDILVNNAGGQFPAPAELMSENGWKAVIDNNLNGTFFMMQKMAQNFFIPQRSGVIVNIIVEMLRGFPGMAHTGAARAGIENLTKTLAQEWAEYGIRINAVAPGIIDSSGLDVYPEPVKAFLEDMKDANLMKRLGTVEDVANAVMFFASPLSSYTSGTTMYVDGLDHLAGNRMHFYKTLKKLME